MAVSKHCSFSPLLFLCRSLIKTHARKRNLFPVAKEHVFVVELTDEEAETLQDTPFRFQEDQNRYLLQPRDLDAREELLLLHPYQDEPSEHLRFADCGVVVDLTDKGANSIRVYKLDDADLERERQEAQERARRKFNAAFVYAEEILEKARDDCRQFAWQKLERWKQGEEKFSRAGLDYITYVMNMPESS